MILVCLSSTLLYITASPLMLYRSYDFEKVVQVEYPITVYFQINGGRVIVEGTDKDQLEVSMETRFNSVYESMSSGYQTKENGDLVFRREKYSDVIVKVKAPGHVTFVVEELPVNAVFEDFGGGIRITNKGDNHIEDCTGPIHIDKGLGNIHIEDSGSAEGSKVKLLRGGLRLKRPTGPFTVEHNSGEVELLEPQQVDFTSTLESHVTVVVSKEPAAPITLTAVSGSISIDTFASGPFSIDAQSEKGRVIVEDEDYSDNESGQENQYIGHHKKPGPLYKIRSESMEITLD